LHALGACSWLHYWLPDRESELTDVEEETLASAVKVWDPRLAQATVSYDGDKSDDFVLCTYQCASVSMETDKFATRLEHSKEFLHPQSQGQA
jgi:hypothetical protein